MFAVDDEQSSPFALCKIVHQDVVFGVFLFFALFSDIPLNEIDR
jgi:hypothetical protein